MSRRPSFLVLGAAKSGTTSLCYMVERHPDVYLSEPKEPVFFELEYYRGLPYYLATYYPAWRDEPAAGEGRVFNLYLPFVAPRIAETLPHARLIVILRDPADRAYSHWWHRVTRGYESRSFEAAVTAELAELDAGRRFSGAASAEAWRRNFYEGSSRLRTADPVEVRYVEMGYYAEQIDRYLAFFDRDRIRVFFLEDLNRDRDRVVREAWAHIGVDASHMPANLPPQNTAREAVKSGVAFSLERLSWRLGINRWLPKSLKTAVRELLPSRSAERPRMPEHVRARLVEHYAPRSAELERLLGPGTPVDRWTDDPIGAAGGGDR